MFSIENITVVTRDFARRLIKTVAMTRMVSHYQNFRFTKQTIRKTADYPACKALGMPVPVQSRYVVVHYSPATATALRSKHLKKVSPGK